MSPAHGNTRSDLLRAADVAMYQAKRHRPGAPLAYRSETDPYDRDRLQLIEEFRTALDLRQFELHYQPIISLLEGRVTGFEALVRWHHPTQGLLGPLMFLPLAEHAGLLPRLTRIVLDEATAFAASLTGADRGLTVSVNVSPQDLLDDSLPGVILTTLKTHRLDPGRLVLEITENALVREPERARRLLAPLREAGVKIAVDDFGTGYQSLGQLIALDIDQVKLDRSLVADVADSPKSQAVVQAMATLTRALGLGLIAEGIETTEALQQLRTLGCTCAQGYLFARPTTGADFSQVVARANDAYRTATFERTGERPTSAVPALSGT